MIVMKSLRQSMTEKPSENASNSIMENLFISCQITMRTIVVLTESGHPVNVLNIL